MIEMFVGFYFQTKVISKKCVSFKVIVSIGNSVKHCLRPQRIAHVSHPNWHWISEWRYRLDCRVRSGYNRAGHSNHFADRVVLLPKETVLL